MVAEYGKSQADTSALKHPCDNNFTDMNPSQSHSNHRIAKTRARVLMAMALALFLLLGICVAAGYWFEQKHIDDQVRQSMKAVEKMVRAELFEDTELLKIMLALIQNNQDLQDAWQNRNRDTLLARAKPVLKDIDLTNRVTHFYFIEPDGVCFLRVHKSEQYGDKINRVTFNRAVATGQYAWGAEVGVLGTFTLRVVYPWRIDGEILGYIELGEEIAHTFPEIAEITETQLCMILDKANLDRESWQQRPRRLFGADAWETLDNYTVVDSTDTSIPENMKRCLATFERTGNPDLRLKLDLDEKQYQGGLVPLKNLRNKQVGYLVVLRDVTADMRALWSLMGDLASVCILIFTTLFAVSYFYLGRLDKEIAAAYRELEQPVDEIHKAISHQEKTIEVTVN